MHIHTPKENHSDSLRNVKRCEGEREREGERAAHDGWAEKEAEKEESGEREGASLNDIHTERIYRVTQKSRYSTTEVYFILRKT